MGEWLTRVRADFPYREGWVYLQSAGAGLAFPGAAAAAGQYFVDVAALGCDAQSLWHRPAASAKERMARLLGVPRADVGFFRNTSEVINLAANSVEWRPGDEVVVAADDYPGVVLPWGRAETAGGTVIQVDPLDVHQREQQLLDALTPRTRVLAVSHVHPWTGTKLDLARLGRACRDVGALLVVDGIQALGATPVDLTYVDVYASAVFKWMLSGFGTSIGVFRERARATLTPAYRGYRNVPPSPEIQYADPSYPGLYVLDATTAYLEEIGWPRIFERVDTLTRRVADAVTALGITPVTPSRARAGIVSFHADDPEALVDELLRQQVLVVHKLGLVRVSPHFYNTTDDVDRFAEGLKRSLAQR